MDVEEVDGLDAHSLEAGVELGLEMRLRVVEAPDPGLGIAADAGLGRDGEGRWALALAQVAADHPLGEAHAVDVGSVEVVDAELERCVENGVRRGLGGRAVEGGERHGADTDG